LSYEEDRFYMNRFIAEVGPCIHAVSVVDKKAEKLVADINNKSNYMSRMGCAWGCMAPLFFSVAIGSVAGIIGVLLSIILSPLIGIAIGSLLDKLNEKHFNQGLEYANREAAKARLFRI